MSTIRIAICHPSASATEILRKAIESIPGHVAAWTTRDLDDGVRRAGADPAAVVLLSVDFPGAPVAASVKRLLACSRGAVLLVRTARNERVEDVYDAMEAGALDVVDMPWVDGAGVVQGLPPLARKLAIGARLGSRRASERSLQAVAATPSTLPTHSLPLPASRFTEPEASGHAPALIVIGASTGGPNAISRVLAALPRPCPAAIVLVQHVDESFAPTIASWFTQSSGVPVSIARAGDRIHSGEALLAGTSDHLRVDAEGRVSYVPEPRDYPYRPSVDVFMESVAANHRGTAVGVLLTGMGRDGAKGLMAMRRAGHRTIAQDERSSVIYGMPKAAIESGAAMEVLDVDKIGEAITRALRVGAASPERR